jgi:hypothetical protein
MKITYANKQSFMYIHKFLLTKIVFLEVVLSYTTLKRIGVSELSLFKIAKILQNIHYHNISTL